MKSQPYSSCQSLPASLTDLFNKAEDLAGLVMPGPGLFIPPFLIADSGGGVFTLSPRNLPSKNASQVFPRAVRFACIAYAASASVLVMHCWSHFLDLACALKSEAVPMAPPQQREVLVLCGATFAGRWHKILSVVRASDGRFLNFSVADGLSAETTAARFSTLFPEHPPTREEQMHAADFLDELNVSLSPWVPLPSFNN